MLTRPAAVLALLLFLPLAAPAQESPPEPSLIRQTPMLSPQESLKTIELPDGYQLELVLSEPDIKEPVLCVFDGNGRMYVAEMRSYMQDIQGTDALAPVSRISRHESTKGDGVFDKHRVYLDGLLLPRMILPLDDRVLVGLTNTNDLTLHRDTDGDGVADEQSLWYEGGERGGNMEHQPSGLVWGVDNWIYTTYNSYRLRWNGAGPALKEPTAPNGGQWGLAQDDYGKMWWSNAGGEKGLWNFQTPIVYAAINANGQKAGDFDVVWPLVGAADVEGGAKRFRPEDGTLNHFTGCAGQTVYRGDRLPAELRGNVFLPEPVGRLIRRATVEVKDGITVLTNPYEKDQSEFLRSTDLNFRPVNMTTGPDGCLYIVDMYRGIIQEGNWVKPGGHLHRKVVENGFQNNIGHGRIWRLRHRDFNPGPQPRMLDESPAQWVEHLAHPNGWWRDTAQRLLVFRADESVIPALQRMAREHAQPLARLHALWTLEGLSALTPELVTAKLQDDDAQVRIAAMRAAETLLMAGNASLIEQIKGLRFDANPEVVLQTLYTARRLDWPDWRKDAQATLFSSPSQGVREIGAQLLVEPPKLAGDFSQQDRRRLERGQEIFRTLCFACHGFDGHGMPMPGREHDLLAPSLAKSKTVLKGDSLIRVLLHGLTGPVEGVTYDSQMVGMGNNSNEWIADVASYLRKAFGNQGSLVSKEEVAAVRQNFKDRQHPWTIEELRAGLPQPLMNASEWKLTASDQELDLKRLADGDPATRWSSNRFQSGDEWIAVELPSDTLIAGLELDSAWSGNDYPRAYEVSVSPDGSRWEKPLLAGKGNGAVTELLFSHPVRTRHIRIKQTGGAKGNYWSIHELRVLRPPVPQTTAAK